MRRSQLQRALGRIFGGDAPAASRASRDALEERLMESFDARGVERPPMWSRPALAGVVGVALMVGACVYPVDYDMRLGTRVGILVPMGAADDVDMETIVQYVEETYDIERLEVSARVEHRETAEGTEGTVRMQLDMLAGDVDADAMWADLTEAFPELQGFRMEDELLEGRMEGTLGGKLSRGWVDQIIDRHGVEEARERVLEDLRQQGLGEGAEVEIEDGEGRREVRVKLRRTAMPDE